MIRLRQSHLLFVMCLVLSSVLIGCAAKQTTPEPAAAPPPPEARTEPIPEEPPPAAAYFVHTVALQGESLSIIAKWYTGDLRNWEALALHNPALNPDRIHMGDTIQIPRDLLVTEEPLTQAFVDESRPKRRTAGKSGEKGNDQRTAEPVIAEGVPLFGPRDYGK